MNTLIINPWIIYLISLCNNLKFISIIAICITVVAVVLIGIAWAFDEDDCCDEEDAKAIRQYYMKWIKIPAIVLISSSVLNLAIPYKQDCYAMLVTSQLTPQNIQSVGNDLKSAVDYIFEKIDELEE